MGVQVGSLRLVYFQVKDLNVIGSGLVILLAPRGSSHGSRLHHI